MREGEVTPLRGVWEVKKHAVARRERSADTRRCAACEEGEDTRRCAACGKRRKSPLRGVCQLETHAAARRVRNDVTPLRGESVGGLPRHPRKRSKKTLLEDPRIVIVHLWNRSKLPLRATPQSLRLPRDAHL